MFFLQGGYEVKTKDLKQHIQKLLEDKIGLQLYLLLKKEKEYLLKFINIADEQSADDNTTEELLRGFINAITTKFSNYNEDDEILKLSSADERKNALYYYDLEEMPEEMQILRTVLENEEERTVFNFKEDRLEEISAFIVVIGTAEKQIVLYKQQYPISLLKKDKCMLTPIPHKNRLAKIDSDIIRVDFNYQFFLFEEKIYISDIEKMEKICSFHNIIFNEAQKSIVAIAEMEILDNVQVLQDELGNVSFARKLTRIYSDSKVLGKVDKKTILDFTRVHSYFSKHPLKICDDKILLDTKKSKDTFVKLMNDDFLTSELTKYDYESLAKNDISK